MTERLIRAGGVELATQAFGEPGRPAVLLIAGGLASMLGWPEEFCRRLAGRARYVIRYDHRDTGRSTTDPAGAPSYGFEDLADDAIRVLDGYGIAAAHLVGVSMGGAIAQLAALKHPARVASLTVVSSSPFGADDLDLPPPGAAFFDVFGRVATVDLADGKAASEFMVALGRLCTGSAHVFDPAPWAEMVARDRERARNYPSIRNHLLLHGGDAWTGRLHELEAPLLVIHGTEDAAFTIDHGIALVEAVSGARLLRLEGSGHGLHEADWDRAIAAIVAHTGR